MLGDTSLLGFVAAALVILLTPGPGVIYVVTRSVAQGCRAGLLSAVGLSAGALVHVAAAVAGLSALLAASSGAFTVIRMLGAGYLIYLGLRTLLAREASAATQAVAPRTRYRLFVDGVLVSVLNPKIALFFLAFLPQFVEPSVAPVTQQVLLLGCIYVGLALVTDGAYALLTGSITGWCGGRVVRGPMPRIVSGSVYVGLGASAAFANPDR
jgi:threonine/homoserine/homoserine lactone efflux protein